jgi:UPF0755 protein
MGRRKQLLKIFGIGLIALSFVGLLLYILPFYRLYYSPMSLGQDEAAIIQLDKYTSASSFVHKLEERHFIQHPKLLLTLIRTKNLSQQLKAGIYQIKRGESAMQFVHRVTLGDVLKESFRIIEGTTLVQVSAGLQQAPYLIYESSDWQSIHQSFPSAEGLLLADTYQYDAGSRGKELLLHANKSLLHYLDASWQQRNTGLPYKSPYELLIAASIIEKETANSSEKRLIAGVLVNRLRKNMPLQMDPTVIYALGTNYKGKLSREDLHVDSPYNTYRYRGLPPTPIAMVGKDAIDAAAHPTQTDYLYFVATGDGNHHFSVSYEEQKEAIERYLK